MGFKNFLVIQTGLWIWYVHDFLVEQCLMLVELCSFDDMCTIFKIVLIWRVIDIIGMKPYLINSNSPIY